MKVLKEAHNTERKRRQTTRRKKSEETSKRTQQAEALVADIKQGGMRREEIEIRLDEIF